MINEIKLGFRMMKFSFRYKMNMVCAFVFLLIGGVMLALGGIIGGMYFVFPGLFFGQMIYMLEASTLVRASSHQRAFQTSVPALLSVLINFVIYTILWIAVSVIGSVKEEMSAEMLGALLVFLAFSLLLNCYYAVAYKTFWIATLGFVLVFLVFFGMGGFLYAYLDYFSGGVKVADALAVVVPAGYLLLAAGAAVQYGIARLVYRLDFSKAAFAYCMKKAAQ